MSSSSDSVNEDEPVRLEDLLEFEVFWRDHYEWLRDRGYVLRPRYRPGWVASWVGTNTFPFDCEDGQVQPLFEYNLDAIRIADGKPVMLRRADPPSVSDELKIGRLLSSMPPDPRNHCVPTYETITIPELDTEGRNTLVVMPFLVPWGKPDFDTVGEVVDFCTQMFEGLQYIHSLNVAHNDAKTTNIMMDWSPLYPDPPHSLRSSRRMDWSGPSKPSSRTLRPVKYYFIDWNLSRYFDPTSGTPPRLPPGYGGDPSVPEFKRKEPCDPFAVDVYCLGNVIREKFIVGDPVFHYPPRRNVEFLEELVSDMTHDDPTKRPTMTEVVSRFEVIRKGLSWWKLRSRVSAKTASSLLYRLYSPFHWIVQLSYIIRRIPAIPDYTRNKEYSNV
ncbi:hypothetical protein GYMLUDRAFT_47614 [Collybiopsis luxurians FD-317 M1]|uniref:Unplaced genomic scaffold GYMLUscaffold_56, whole genome shotgun sequence n=1 Tax=Collybiopsis luxurians FD-317 M1 TaxID=944289 RepID=A0A0D0AYC0_9AGAR|nr:hypothetical protein GYMLUDRAFT_47614 [Collybiopsis luxurians FD-317 M1]